MTSPTPRAELRAKVEAVVLEQFETVGPDRIDQAAIVKQFLDRAARATLFRWIDAYIKSGKPGQIVARGIKAAAAERAKITATPSARAAAQAVAQMPVRIALEDFVTPSGSGLKVIKQLEGVMADVRLVIAHAKTEEGKVRNAKLLLAASANLRSCLETGTKMVAAMHAVDQVDHFHGIIMAEIAKISPAVAEAILARVGQVSADWGG